MPAPASPAQPRRRIPRWKIVGGAFLHFALPVFLLIVVLDALHLAALDPGKAALRRELLGDMLRLLGIYGVIGGTATLIALAIDRVSTLLAARRTARDPALHSAARLEGALVAARGRFGAGGDAALGVIVAAECDHRDPRHQRIADHLATLVSTACAALDLASAAGRAPIIARTATALASIAGEAQALAQARAAERDQAAATVAGFIVARYGSSAVEQSPAAPTDFAGEPK